MNQEIYYLDKEDVLSLHEQLLSEYGGSPGIKDMNQLESVLAQPQAGFGDIEFFPTIFQKAAAYMYYFATGHCFVDGNKRTAYMSAWTFLAVNGYNVVAETNNSFKLTLFVVQASQKKPGYVSIDSETLIEEIGMWLKIHAVKITPEDIR